MTQSSEAIFERSPLVSIVIPAYNEERYLPLCLESLKKQRYPGRYEVIVVDNGSTDGTAGIAIRSGARVVYENKKGPASARQRGAEAAAGKIIAFIDADTQAPAGWLSNIVARFARDPETVVVSGPYVFVDAGRLFKCVSYIGNFTSIVIDHLFRKVFRKGGALWGSNFAVRRSAFFEIGGFDTNIRFYGEDYELSLRLKKAGKAAVMPRLFVLTSSRGLKRKGVVTQYWNWIMDYFTVLFWRRPLPDRLEDLPARTCRVVADHLSWQRVYSSLKYVVAATGLFWLHTLPLWEVWGRLLYGSEIIAAGVLLAFDGIYPRSQFFGRVRSNGNRNHRKIALTFDDGPNEPYTSQVLNILERHTVRATFFVIGENAQRHPEVCRQIVAGRNVIGNHSYNHRKSLCLSWGKAIARDVELARQTILECARYDAKLFRPPHGFRTPWLMRTLHRLGYTVVTWDNMTSDWEARMPVERIVKNILKKAKPGGIIVLHDGRDTRASYDRSRMLQALPQIINGLKQRGFDFVTVPELLCAESDQAVDFSSAFS